mgnify:CR=1 FL=1
MSEDILSMFDKEKLDLSNIEKMFNVDIKGLTFGLTSFQINNFVLNKREFTTDFAQFKQSRFEIRNRLLVLIDLYYQYREYIINKKLAEGRIEKIKNEEKYEKIKDARVELQQLDIDKNDFRIGGTLNEATKIIQEIQSLYTVYSKYRHFELLPQDKIDKLEEECWLLKSAYYSELPERYNLTPAGFVKYPHEVEGGVQRLIQEAKNQKENAERRLINGEK